MEAYNEERQAIVDSFIREPDKFKLTKKQKRRFEKKLEIADKKFEIVSFQRSQRRERVRKKRLKCKNIKK